MFWRKSYGKDEESLARKLCDFLPLDLSWILRIAGPSIALHSKGEDVQYGALLRETREEEKERFLKGEVESPNIIHPYVEDIDFSIFRRGLRDIRKHANGLMSKSVSNLYRETIDEAFIQLDLLEAVKQSDGPMAHNISSKLYGLPETSRFKMALGRVFQTAKTCILTPNLPDSVYEKAHHLLEDELVSYAIKPKEIDIIHNSEESEAIEDISPRNVTVNDVFTIFQEGIKAYGLDDAGWKVTVSDDSEVTNVWIKEKMVYLPKTGRRIWTVNSAIDLFKHEVEGHVLRAESGHSSNLKLLGIGLANNLPTEEALATAHKFLDQLPPEDDGRIALLATGLASGILSSPRSFRQTFDFLCHYRFIERWPFVRDESTIGAEIAEQTYKTCLRVFRGGVSASANNWCFTKDLVYSEGRRALAELLRNKAAVEQNSILQVLKAGRTSHAPHHLSVLAELGITRPQIEAIPSIDLTLRNLI